MDADSNFALEIAARPLEIRTWLHGNLSSPYPTVPSLTLYDVLLATACASQTNRQQTPPCAIELS